MAQAQAARAEALTQREAALKQLSRRTTIGLIAASSLTAAAGGLAYWGMDAERRFNSARERAADAEKRSIEQAIRKEAMRTDIKGQLAAYGASPGQTAAEGPQGGHSPYTMHLLEELSDSWASVQMACSRANQKVLHSSITHQRPFLSSDLNGEIYLQRHPPTRRRAAIVISEDRGEERGQLYNTERDGLAWEAFLRDTCGFEVVRLKNPDLDTFRQAAAKSPFALPGRPAGGRVPVDPTLVQKAAIVWEEKLPVSAPEDTLLLFVFAGTGASKGGTNYLMVDDADLNAPASLTITMMPLLEIQTALRRNAAASVLILDTNFQVLGNQR